MITYEDLVRVESQLARRQEAAAISAECARIGRLWERPRFAIIAENLAAVAASDDEREAEVEVKRAGDKLYAFLRKTPAYDPKYVNHPSMFDQ
jgi:hypothetical protein